MLRLILCSLSISFLLSIPAYSETLSGTYAVRVPSKNPFIATVTLSKGQVTNFTMQKNEILARSATANSKSIAIEVEFLGGCGKGSRGQMKIDVSGNDLVFRQWKGRCAKKSANFNVRNKIKMTKQ